MHAKSVLKKVPGNSPMPFRWTANPYRGCSHAYTYCLSGETEILMGDGRTKPLAEIKVGDEIKGTEQDGTRRRYARTKVLAHWPTVKNSYRITLADGTELVASGDHQFLTDRGWRQVADGVVASPGQPHLLPGSKLVGTGRFAPAPVHDREYRTGYLCGMVKGQQLLRTGGLRPVA